jgi:cell division control protein 6
LNNCDVLNGVFDHFLEGIPIFKNREVLRHDYIPDSLPHREDQVRFLGQMIAPLLKVERCSNIFVYGKTGTGKTAVMKYVLNKLSQKALEINSQVKVCYVNCRMAGTEYRVFTRLCDAVDVRVPFTGLALGEVFDRFKKGVDSEKHVFIAVLDEIDALVKLRGDILLYELTRINETLRRGRTTLVGISNDLRFKEFLDPRVLSSLSEEEIVFKPYNADELSDILFDRAKRAFQENIVSEGPISLCAALAAAEHGDARRALDLLRVAGEIAEREGSTQLIENHIRQAEKRIEHDRVTEALKNLPFHSKLVLSSVYLLSKDQAQAHQVSVTGNIYEVYCELCQHSGMAPLTQRRVSGLVNELDAIGLLNTQVINMGRYGRTKKIRLGITPKILKEVFANSRFSSTLEYTPKHLAEISGGRH